MAGLLLASILLLLLNGCAAQSNSDRGKLEGRILPSQVLMDVSRLQADTRAVLNNGEFVAYIRDDGSFTFNEVTSGSYVLDVFNHEFIFDKLRIEFSAQEKSKPKVTLASIVPYDNQPALQYPIRLEAKAPVDYFTKREGWNIMSLFSNPMLIMMVVMLGFAYIMPKLMENMDPEALKEVQEQQNSILQGATVNEEEEKAIFGGGDVSERLVSFFGGNQNSNSSTPSSSSKKDSVKSKQSK